MRALPVAAILLFASAAEAAPPVRRHRFEAYAGVGVGNAVCDNEKPENDCPVDPGAGGTFALGATFRFHPHLAIGLEAGIWGFRTRESWRGKLADPATDVRFSAAYLSPHFRWYWLSRGVADPYLQAGVGFGSVGASAENQAGKYDARFNGVGVHLGIGAEWYVARFLRLGPQGMVYLHRSTRVCETSNGDQICRDARNDEAVLAWRILLLQGTFVFG